MEEHTNLAAGSFKAVSISAVSKLPMNPIEFTDATMNLEGNLIALRDYERILFFPRTPLQTVANALESSACDFESPTELLSDQRQFESVTFLSSLQFAEVSECLNALPCTLNAAVYRLIFNIAPIQSRPAFPPPNSAPKPTPPSVTRPTATAPKATASAPKPIAPAPKPTASALKPAAPSVTKPKAPAPKLSASAPKPAAPAGTKPSALAPKPSNSALKPAPVKKEKI